MQFWQFLHVKALVLRPNCLMTRTPLVFITGSRSLLYFFNYWNMIPGFLREHGYEVRVWNLPWRDGDAQFQILQMLLLSSRTSVHLLGDSSSVGMLKRIQLTNPDRISSITTPDELSLPESKACTWADFILRFAFGAHVFLLRLSHKGAGAGFAVAQQNELGLYEGSQPWQIENAYLNRAISLAENELAN